VKQRILTALVLLAVVVGVLFFDQTGVGANILGRLAISAVAWELAGLIRASRWLLAFLSQIIIIPFERVDHPAYLVLFTMIGVEGLRTLARTHAISGDEDQGLENPNLWRNILVVPFLKGAGSALILLTASGGNAFPLILTAAIPIWAGDTAAIFAGKAFGKHKLAPSISPNKTWEGSIANLLAAVGAAPALGYFLKYPMDKMLLLGVSCGVIGQLGDLFESYLKRQAGVKDSGNLLPGHGGVFDRLDSLLMTAPFSYWILSSFLK
jgi:phosphatidate cytidylyltransferase